MAFHTCTVGRLRYYRRIFSEIVRRLSALDCRKSAFLYVSLTAGSSVKNSSAPWAWVTTSIIEPEGPLFEASGRGSLTLMAENGRVDNVDNSDAITIDKINADINNQAEQIIKARTQVTAKKQNVYMGGQSRT